MTEIAPTGAGTLPPTLQDRLERLERDFTALLDEIERNNGAMSLAVPRDVTAARGELNLAVLCAARAIARGAGGKR